MTSGELMTRDAINYFPDGCRDKACLVSTMTVFYNKLETISPESVADPPYWFRSSNPLYAAFTLVGETQRCQYSMSTLTIFSISAIVFCLM
jgi:hypothetical protein